MNQHASPVPDIVDLRRVVLVTVLGGGYVISQFLRNTVGVIGPDLSAELGLRPADLGMLASVFFFTFAAAQIPAGVLLDRYGARAVMVAFLALAVAGCLGMAASDGFAQLIAARAITGVGCACLLMGPLAIFARWFPKERFALLTAILLALGNLGTLGASAPLAYGAAAFGWRATFAAVAAIAAVTAVIIALVVRDAPPGAPPATSRGESWGAAFAGLRTVTRTPSVWRLFAIHTVVYGCFVTVFGLWGGPFLADVHGYDLVERGNVLLVMAVAQIAGLLLWGSANRMLGGYRRPVLIGGSASVALLVFIAAVPDAGPAVLIAWFAAFGLVNGYASVMIAHGRTLFADAHVGRGLTLLNLANMGGVFVLQALTGFVMQAFSGGDVAAASDPDAYRAMFLTLAGLLAAGLFIYRKAWDPTADASEKNSRRVA